MNSFGGHSRSLRARRRSHTHEHDAIVEILLWHNQVITDWALQGWEEETQKEMIRLGISVEWNPYVDILWDANTGRNAVSRRHTPMAHTRASALLSLLYWNRLNLLCAPQFLPAAVRWRMKYLVGRTRSCSGHWKCGTFNWISARKSPARKGGGVFMCHGDLDPYHVLSKNFFF